MAQIKSGDLSDDCCNFLLHRGFAFPQQGIFLGSERLGLCLLCRSDSLAFACCHGSLSLMILELVISFMEHTCIIPPKLIIASNFKGVWPFVPLAPSWHFVLFLLRFMNTLMKCCLHELLALASYPSWAGFSNFSNISDMDSLHNLVSPKCLEIHIDMEFKCSINRNMHVLTTFTNMQKYSYTFTNTHKGTRK